MKTKKRTFFPKSGSEKFNSVLPVECPHCGAYSTPQIVASSNLDFLNYKLWLFVFFNDCCEKHSYALYKRMGENAEFLGILPVFHKTYQLPESIQKISPRFVSLFNQCFDAEENGSVELAGSGYRNALEILIKDYAIQELQKNKKEVCKKSLSKCIEDYLPTVSLAQSADVIRVLGNDHTHYERKYGDIDLEVLKRYLHIFINTIDCDYLIRHPIVKTNPNLPIE
ncbi:hypothetical protein AC844P1_00024 [Anaerostipes phage AC844P1]|nr:hypothetical protein AC844P1_00024 [Anaerostipes phage AC844P1]WAX05294.1 hypothetical protein AC844P2_00024 [Anaerostipes phage AC844P2]WAX05353.1 hypothetical protein AC844P3_00024 [Anaerostipes phage AC844P3]